MSVGKRRSYIALDEIELEAKRAASVASEPVALDVAEAKRRLIEKLRADRKLREDRES